MSRHRIVSSFIVAACLMLATGAHLANATVGSATLLQDASAISMLATPKSGAALLEELVRRVKDIGDYKFDAALDSMKGGKVVRATGTFYFKPASSIRVEVGDYGMKSGSILVKGPDGKITGKGGPSMWGMKMGLSPDSRLLQMPNGLSAVECDLGSLLARLKSEVTGGCKLVAGERPVRVESLGTQVIVLETQRPQGSGTQVVDRLFIDPAQRLPVQWDLFENGALSSRTTFKSYQLKAHWDDSQFNI